ncbi:MAG: hypothetical protein C4538_10480 [Nitrospiraceae bacterium]|nr:MAG: hypothetical protein C4538_10480 [Nitrospiraceae bacterium]
MEQTSYKDLRQYCYFSCLSDGALEALSQKLEHVNLSAGTHIIKEGAPADAFYLISKGEVEVTKKTDTGQAATIAVSGRGESFGEMALLTCLPRFCSVTARTDVTLLKLPKPEFEEIIRADSAFAGAMVDRHQRFYLFNELKMLQPFALLEPEKMSALTGKLKEKRFTLGQTIIAQGERGDEYFIVKSGKVEVLKKMLGEEPEHVAILEEGQAFGEEALLTDSPRSATVRTIDETVLWVLAKSDFDSVVKSSFLKEVDPLAVLNGAKGNITFLDVRMKMEFDEEHIPEAINIPLDEIRKRYAELDNSREYYAYCLLGARSATAAFLLNSQGFNARSIKGGILNWPGPLEKGSDGIHTPFKPT